MKLGPPIILSTFVNVGPGSSHSIMDMGQLVAPHREPLRVSEIRFYTGIPAGVTPQVTTNAYVNPGSEVRATIHVGQYQITDDIPVWALGPQCDTDMEVIQSVTGCYRWRLVKPLYVPPGMGFRVSVRRVVLPGTGTGTYSGNLPVWCSIVAQTVEGALPKTMEVPFAASYAPTPVAANAPTKFTSGPQDLLNTTLNPLELKYAVGRLGLFYNSGLAAPGPVIEVWDVNDAGIDVQAPCTMACRGYKIIPANTEFNSAFDYARRTLRLYDFMLDPGDRFLFSMDYPVGIPADWLGTHGQYSWSPNITLVGSRKESVP